MSTVHNPTNFNPADYEVVDYLDNRRPEYCGQTVEAYRAIVEFWESDMARVLGADWRKVAHRCVHCGNTNVRYITAVRHIPTAAIVVFGADCTERLHFEDRHAFKLAILKSAAAARAESAKRHEQVEAFVAARPELAEARTRLTDPVHARNLFAHDVFRKLAIYGSISDRQIEAVLASMRRDVEITAQRAAEAAEVKGEAPNGRVDVEGVVLMVKEYETGHPFETVHKMLLKTANNARVFCTVPAAALGRVERGASVKVRATWTRKPTDPSFATGSRPHLLA